MPYSFLNDVETVLGKGLNVIFALAQIDQRSLSKLDDSDNAKLNATANECAPMKCRKCVEDACAGLKKNEGWVKPAKYVPTKCFYKNRNKIRKITMLTTIDTMFCR